MPLHHIAMCVQAAVHIFTCLLSLEIKNSKIQKYKIPLHWITMTASIWNIAPVLNKPCRFSDWKSSLYRRATVARFQHVS